MPLNKLDAISQRFVQHAELAQALAANVAECLSAAIAARGNATIAFSGGSTPKLFMKALAAQSVDWASVTLTLVDDRCVPASEDRSNAKLLGDAFLSHLDTAFSGDAAPRFYPLFLEGESLAECNQRFDTMPLPFDCLILGMGDDAHTASFFPDADNLAQMIDLDDSSLVGETRSAASVERRLTFRLPAVLASRNVVLHICGDKKWQVLSQACLALDAAELSAVETEFPIMSVLGRSTMVQHDGVPVAVFHATHC